MDITKKYAVCVTSYNNVGSIKESIESILCQLDDRFELIVVDNCSTDGSYEILLQLSKGSRQLRVIGQRCSRGKGRQIAFENTTGTYVIANIDTDEVYLPILPSLLDFYHDRCEGKILNVQAGIDDDARGAQNVTIGPRLLLEQLGGWRNLQLGEDWDLWSRSAKIERYAWTVFRLVRDINSHVEREKFSKKVGFRHLKYREMLRLGRPVFAVGENVGIGQRVVYSEARLSALFRRFPKDSFIKEFDEFLEGTYVDSSDYVPQMPISRVDQDSTHPSP